MIKEIKDCFKADKFLYSKHARDEMEIDEFGEIKEKEVYEAVLNGKIIELYLEDDPYPSCFYMGELLKKDDFISFVHMREMRI